MILAAITVYKCDGCPVIIVVHAADEEITFHDQWFVSLTKDFCPDCRNKIENLSAIEIAQETDQSALDQLKKMASPEEAQHVS